MIRQKIFLFGDSITEESFSDGGWGASLADLLRRKADIVLLGYSGYNTRWALKVVERVFPAAKEDGGESPAAVTVFFGANDACLPERCSGFQHVPLHEYKQNLRSIVSFLKNRWPQTAIILITPPPIHEEARLRYPYIENTTGLPERTNEVAGLYAKACVEVAKECQILVIDLWSKMQQIPNWQTECLWDGLHLSRVGNKVLFEEVANKLNEESIGAEELAVDLPLIEDVDPKDPLKAFHEF
ncbi:PREDICTED: GDSL esterase/lipase At5g45920-like [Camelina sativa]|uniref:GDSL esterase/lipase At5g45920-like n=1 Tax=Camelina sativa TaxID=90675 RepID=A0ABM0UII8_CAMSA|nr:PREDICTED: GDSL esterase/lipase At5g45920-like [Camelina sativa]